MPMYCRTGISLGEGPVVFLEQRQWLHFIRMNGVSCRKTEQHREVWNKIREAYALSPIDICRPGTEAEKQRTTPMMSCGGLCGWILNRVYMASKGKGGHADVMDKWLGCWVGVGIVGMAGCAALSENGALPSLNLHEGLSLVVSDVGTL